MAFILIIHFFIYGHHMKNIYFIILIILLTSCKTTYYQIKTLEKDSEIDNGREIVYKADSLAEFAINFESITNDDIEFFVYANNKSDSVIVVDPGSFRIEYSNNLDSLYNGFPNIFRYFYDPETQIKIVNGQIKRVSEKKGLYTCLNCGVALLSVVCIIADNDDKNDGSKLTDVAADWIDTQGEILRTAENEENFLKEKREFWKNNVFRTSTLYKNEDTGGRILGKFMCNFNYFSIIIPFNNKEYIFNYEIVKTRK